MKKVGIAILAVALLILAISSIEAVQIIGKSKPITGNLVTGESISGKATSQQVEMNITVLPFQQIITIIQPENITYDFSPNETYLLNLSTSSNFAVDTWWFSLYDLNHSETVYENLTFTPDSSFIARKWESKLMVYANNSTGGIINASIEFYINLNNTAPTISIDNQIFSCENSYLSYFFNVTDLNERMELIDLSPKEIFFLSNSTPDPDDYEFNYKVNYTTWAHEIFSVLLNKTHVGGPNNGSDTHTRNVIAYDGTYFDIEAVNLIVIEKNNPPNVTNPGVQTIYSSGENSTFYHEIWAEDIEDGNITSGNLTANISFQGEHLFNITPQGIINFSANNSGPSVNNITVCISDLGLQNPHQNISLCNETGSNASSCVNFSLTITDENRQPNITSYWPLTSEFSATGLVNSYLNITTYDPDGTIPDAYWYVDGLLVEYDSGSSLNELNYAFRCGVGGNHTIRVIITDGLLTDQKEWNVSVEEVACPETPVTGGGGGGGGPARACIPKWACRDWEMCMNIKQVLESGGISGEEYRSAKENCEERGLSEEKCGIQKRLCIDVNKCYQDSLEKTETKTCHYTSDPSCYDNIKNCHHGSCELLVDCGGPCAVCPTCSDNIQNQGEEGVDCGGPCPSECEPEKPAPPPLNYRYGFLLLIILLILYILNKTFRIIEKSSKEHRRLILSIILIALIVFSGVFVYFYSLYHVGDFVYKKNANIIGEIKNTSLTLSPLIQWQDGSYTKEFIFSIENVNKLGNNRILEFLEENNKQQFSLYSWSYEGFALSENMPIKRMDELDKFTVKLKEEECIPSFICGQWSECKVDYSLYEMSEEKLTYGTRERFCRDSSECMADFIYSERCELKDSVMIHKVVKEEETSFEVYDTKSRLVARISRIIEKGVEKLNIEIIG